MNKEPQLNKAFLDRVLDRLKPKVVDRNLFTDVKLVEQRAVYRDIKALVAYLGKEVKFPCTGSQLKKAVNAYSSGEKVRDLAAISAFNEACDSILSQYRHRKSA